MLARSYERPPSVCTPRIYSPTIVDLAPRGPRLSRVRLTESCFPSGFDLLRPGVPEDVTCPWLCEAREPAGISCKGIRECRSKRRSSKGDTAGGRFATRRTWSPSETEIESALPCGPRTPWPGAGCVQVAQGYCSRLRSYERRGSIAERSGSGTMRRVTTKRYSPRFWREESRRAKASIGPPPQQAVAGSHPYGLPSGGSMQAPSRSTARL